VGKSDELQVKVEHYSDSKIGSTPERVLLTSASIKVIL
jgi:hypothetical protein